MTTLLKQEDSALACSRNGSESLLSAARSGTVGRRSSTRPRSSALGDRAGGAGRSTGSRSRAPGSLTSRRAEPRARRLAAPGSPGSGGRAPAARPRACCGSSTIASRSDAWWAAKSPLTVLRLLIRPWRSALFALSSRATTSRFETKPARSPGWVPSSAWFTWEVYSVGRRRGPEGLLEALGAAVLVERAAELLQEDLEVLPHRRLQRGEDLVELDGARGLGLGDHRAAVAARARPGCPDAGRRTGCPRGRGVAAAAASRPGGSAGPCP